MPPGTKGRAAGNEFSDDAGTLHALSTLYEDNVNEATKMRDFPIASEEAYALLQHDWLDAIRKNRKPEIDGWEALKDLACAYAILESSTLCQRIRVEEVLEGRIETYQRGLNEHYGIE